MVSSTTTMETPIAAIRFQTPQTPVCRPKT
jgi:hypothetical protein